VAGASYSLVVCLEIPTMGFSESIRHHGYLNNVNLLRPLSQRLSSCMALEPANFATIIQSLMAEKTTILATMGFLLEVVLIMA